MQKINLSILKRLVEELEISIANAEKKSEATQNNAIEFTIEMFKAAGLCAGINKEASMLIADISYLVQANQTQDLLLGKIISEHKNNKSGDN